MAIHTVLYDSTRRDMPVELSQQCVADLTEKQLLWVDVFPVTEEDLAQIAECFHLEPRAVEHLRNPPDRPRLENYGNYFLIKANALSQTDDPSVPGPAGSTRPRVTSAGISGGVGETGLVFYIGGEFVITVHPEPVTFLQTFRQRVLTDSQLGLLDAPSFLAALLDWHLTDFFRVVEDLEREVDRLDEVALRSDEEERLLPRLVGLRRRVGRLRRILSPHREVYSALLRPDFQIISGSKSVETYRLLHDRLERAIETIENTRELLLGSFEVFATQTAARTNDIMKLLTVVSVTLLPVSTIAGILGMNFGARMFESNDVGFWATVACMLILVGSILAYARRRRWL